MVTNRRIFLQSSMAGLTALTAAGGASKASEKIIIGVIGVRGRGRDLLKEFSGNQDVEVAYVCDPDLNVVPKALGVLPERHKRVPKVVQDMRTVIGDKDVNAIVVATPDHWHALATIWGCQAEKHVYCEKPVSHNLVEGRRMIEAARKYNRVVQVGTQRRSEDTLREAAEFVKSGKLGKIPFARTWIAGNRKSIGKKSDGKAPAKVDYNLWLGPAPQHAFNPNRFHYNWHWFWDYGTGELGNNGIHGLDVVRLLMGNLDAPTRVTCGGGKLFYDDDQQTPDTQIATFDFPTCSVVWEHRIWSKTGPYNQSFGVELMGEKGTLVMDNKGWHVEHGPEASGKFSGLMQKNHVRNFLECIKKGGKPTADIEEGHKSTRLCHLGNIAYRLSRTLKFDGASETIVDDAEATKMLGRTYRKGFEIPAKV